MPNKEIIPIFFACDNNFVKYTIVSLTSIIDNASKDYNYNVHILNTGISKDMEAKALELQNENFNIELNDVSAYLDKISALLPTRDYYTKTTYFRMFIAEMFPQYKKALYLDSDTVILGDISELYSYDLKNNYIGAIVEQAMVQNRIFGDYVECVLNVKRNKCFNAGVLVINCEKFRSDSILKKFIKLVGKYTFVVTQDQDYLNVICKDKVLLLDSKWNTEVFGNIVCPEDKVCLFHYIMIEKPWHYENCRMGKYFWHYAKKTSCYDEICSVAKNYSEEEIKRDSLVCENLEKKALDEIEKYRNEALCVSTLDFWSEDSFTERLKYNS